MVMRVKCYEHITPVLCVCSLHWLPFLKQIQFKILLHVYKAIHGLAPPYINSLISQKSPSSSMSLLSTSKIHLQLSNAPRTYTRYGDRAFSVAAPTCWNKLPLHIRDSSSISSFKTQLKTHFFRQR